MLSFPSLISGGAIAAGVLRLFLVTLVSGSMDSPLPALLDRFADLLVRHRTRILAGSVVLTIVSVFWAARLSFEQSIESLYARDDPHLEDYVESKALFGGDELVAVAYRDPQLFEEAGFERVRELSRELSKIRGVRASSTQNLADGLDTAFGSAKFAFLRKRREQVLQFFEGILVGADRQTTAVVLRLEAEGEAVIPSDQTFDVFRDQTIRAIREVAREHAERYGLPTSVAGEPVQVHDMFEYVQEDGARLGWASLFLMAVVIWVLFRNARWVLLPVLVVQVTLVWTKAILVLWGIPLTMVSSILESLVTIIGVATVMHISLVYCELRAELDAVGAMRRALVLLAADVFWVSATTAAGFAAQLSSHVYPVRSFGVMMTLGSTLVVAAMAAILPGGILMGQSTSDRLIGSADSSRLARGLALLTHWVERHPWRVLGVCGVVTALALSGMFGIRVETDFTRNFKDSSPIVRAVEFIEQNLGGAGTWEVNFPAPEVLDEEFLGRVRTLAEQLRDVEVTAGGTQARLTKVLAITDGIDLVPRVPILVPSLARQMQVLETIQPEFASSLYNPPRGRMRIVLRARERQQAELKQKLIDETTRLAREAFPSAEEKPATATGLFVLLTFLIDSLLGDQWSSFFWGATGIIGMMALAYRSVRIGLISLFPNLLPIVMVIGTMGWLDLPINIATAMISAVSMGLTVDASIFYISAFLRARRSGLDTSGAIGAAQRDVGRALIYSNLALILGFLVLTLSNFVPLIYFGTLVSVAMVGGLAGNLVLLPLLLRFGAPAPRN